MKLLVFLLLCIIGCTADAAFCLGVVGEAENLGVGTAKPEVGLYVFGDLFVILVAFILVIWRVRCLVRTAAEQARPSAPAQPAVR